MNIKLIPILCAFAACAALPANAAQDHAATPLPVAKPESVGMSSQRLQQIGVALRDRIARKLMPGAVVAIARRGKLVYYEAFGSLGDAAETPMPRDAIFAIASMTKPLTAVGVLQLAEHGRVLLSAPVGTYLPQLEKRTVATAAGGTEPARRQPTIQDLLRHTAGMTYGIRGLRADVRGDELSARYAELNRNLSATDFLAKLGRLPLQYQPGTRWEYSIGPDVAGLALEAVTGERLGQYLQANLFAPLRMLDTSFVVPSDKLARLARPGAGGPTIPDAAVPPGHECGDACAYSTAADYLRFAEMLRRGGTLDGAYVLGRKSVEFMTSDQLAPDVNTDMLYNDWPYLGGYGFGLSVAVRRGAGLGGMPGSPGDFNWGGAFGTYFWVDPKEELSVVLMDYAQPGEGRALRSLIETLVYSALAN